MINNKLLEIFINRLMESVTDLLRKLFRFYVDGFKGMSGWGRKVWLIIIIKLFVIFVILRIFFFQGFLSKNFNSDKERSEHVINELINQSDLHDR
jgi:hypothetical protein